MMTTVYLHAGWENENDEAFKRRMSKQTPRCSGIWGDLVAVSESEKADYHIAFNQPTDQLENDKLLLFCKEPPNIQACKGWEKRNHLGSFPVEEYYVPQDWFLDKTYDELKNNAPPKKTKPLSWVTSDKGRQPNPIKKRARNLAMNIGDLKYYGRKIGLIDGKVTDEHIYRMEFLDRLVADNPGYLDLYGRGEFSGPYYKGELPDHFDKWKGLAPYRYSLAIENYHGPNYFSEKVVDALLSWSMPIYWGCTNLENFLPKESFIEIDIKSAGPHRVKEILNSNRQEDNMDAIAEARRRILDQYQVWPTIEQAIQDWIIED